MMDTEEAASEGLACVGAVLVEKFAPGRVAPEEAFDYVILVTNAAGRTVQSIVLVESLLSPIRIEESTPPSQSDEPHMGRWLLGPIPPGGRVSVRVTCRTRKVIHFRSHTAISYSIGS